jgi:signal transduction histidine kinase/ActR/RegA family two-component response regulator
VVSQQELSCCAQCSRRSIICARKIRSQGVAALRLRTHLVALVLVAVAPLLILTVIAVRRDLQEQRNILDRGMHNTVWALSQAVDLEIKTSLAVLETLAASPDLEARDFKSFHALCMRAITGRKDAWIVLFDRSGQQIVNSSRPFGSPLPNPFRYTTPAAADPRYPLLPLGGAAPVRKVFETGQPVVSDLFVALDSRRPTIGVGIPVIGKGRVLYALEMSVDPDALLRLLMDQHPRVDSVVSLLDGSGVVIARTLDSARLVGLPLAPELAEQIAKMGEGSGVGRTREGMSVYHVFRRSKLTGWTTSLGVSQAVVSGPMNRSIMLLTGGVTGALVLGLGAAFVLGKRISTPISTLVGAAGVMARGERVDLKISTVREVEELHGALITAGQAVREGMAERERRLIAEARRVEAQLANQAKDEFLTMLSHELRTPINAVYGWVRMLHAGQVADEAKQRALDAILRNASAQVQLIDDLLDMSRIVSGKMRLDVRLADLKAVIEAALDAVRPAANGKAIRLQAVLDPRARPITGDPDRLQQVVWNLLMNAVKFTPKGGRVQVHLQRVNSHVEIVVSDTGQGISPGLLPVIFERFRQADSSTTRAQAGLGLGLALVRHLVEAHGGTVTAQSPGEGKGATFIVKLPVTLAKLDNATIERVHPTARVVMPTFTGPALEGLRVLVVDDDLDALDLATAILTGARAHVRACQSAAEALIVFRDWRPDVLIADIEMPGEDGLSLIRKIRAMEVAQGGKVPAIALTAYGRVEDRLRTLSAGFSMHVPKPVDPAELTTVVASLAGRQDPRQN